MNFCFKLIHDFHVSMKHLYDLLQDNVIFHWNIELETLLQRIETSFQDVILTLLDTSHSFFIRAESSLFGIGCVIFQKNT